jgi:hypothetical protein
MSSEFLIFNHALILTNLSDRLILYNRGGVDYLRSGNSGYELSKCIKVKGADQVECDGVNLLSLAATAARDQNVVYFLPKNINGFDIGKAAWKNGYRNRIELEQNILNGKLKTVTVYLSQK